MTKCTKCGSCQIIKDETGQNAIFCEACGGAVEVVSDELPFVVGFYDITITVNSETSLLPWASLSEVLK